MRTAPLRFLSLFYNKISSLFQKQPCAYWLIPIFLWLITETSLYAQSLVSGGNFGHSSFAISADGKLFAWGDNYRGQLGIGTLNISAFPIDISGYGEMAGKTIVRVTSGRDHTLALAADGTVYSWGYGNFGELGNGTEASTIPLQVTGLADIIAIAAGYDHSLALKSDGTVYAWGYNNNGQLGNGNYNSSAEPVPVVGLTGITAIAGAPSHSLALKSDGTVYAWGAGNAGQLGNGIFYGPPNYNSPVPVRVSNLTNITTIAGGISNSLALKSDGSVYIWGSNYYGELGNGTNLTSPPYGVAVPVKVPSLSSITDIAAGSFHYLALSSAGTVYAWGSGGAGQLGNGIFYQDEPSGSALPVPVIGLYGITDIAGGDNHSLALKSDGTVYAWGYGNEGQLGNGIFYSSVPLGSAIPVLVAGLNLIQSLPPDSGDKEKPTLDWDKTIGGNENDNLHAIQQTTDGGYILGGESWSNRSGDKSENAKGLTDFWVVKLNAAGQIEWDKTLGGNSYDNLHAIQQTADGGYILGGLSDSDASRDKSQNARGEYDFWVVKLNASGQKEWDKTIGGSDRDYVNALQQTSDGGYILGGFSNSGATGDKSENRRDEIADYWVVKLNAAGNKEWDKTLGGTSGDVLHAIRQTADGGYILGGYTGSGASGDKSENGKGGYDYWVVKLDAAGHKEWDKTIGGMDSEILHAIRQTFDGGYILGGSSYSGAGGDKSENIKGAPGLSDYWVVKLNAAGVKEWDKTYGGSNLDELTSLQKTTDGGYILGGYSDSDAGGDKSENARGDWDYWVVKIDAAGNKEWDKTLGGNSQESLSSIQQTTDGGYLIGGHSYSDASGDKSENAKGGGDYWVVKLNASGIKEWDKTIGGEGSSYLTALQQTSDGGYILGGTSDVNANGDKSEHSKGGSDYWLVKINGTGQIEWDKTIGGIRNDELTALEKTIDGGYILGGWSEFMASGDKSENARGNNDYWVVKLNAAGIKEWDKTLGGNSQESLSSIQQTIDGGYLIGGTSNSDASGDKRENTRGNNDYWIVKLNATGCPEWDKTIGGNKEDVLTFVKQITDGSYILGGRSSSDASGDKSENAKGLFDYWIVKLKGEKSLPVFCSPVAVADTIPVENSTSPTTFPLRSLLANDAEELELASFTQPATGTLAYNANNRRFTYTPAPGTTGSVTFTYTLQEDTRLGNPLLVDGQPHYYELVRLPQEITWEQAQALAESRNYNGRQGYLATITSAAENEHIRQLIRNKGWRNYSWLGGSDAAQEGTWRWATGPEAGTLMNYTNWVAGEPNNLGEEDYLVLSWDQGRWNDLSGVATGRIGVKSFVVEYGSASDCSPALTATVTLILPGETPPTLITNKAADNQEAGLKVLQKESLKVYPNPVQDRATIQMGLPATGTYRLDLYDSRGTRVKTISQGQAPTPKTLTVELEVAPYPKGIYLLRLETGQGVLSKRLLIGH